jgi:excisionase family DNA binding protein
MGAILDKVKRSFKGNESKQRNGYLTTTEFAKLCGVSRFTIINWAKQGRIKTIKTAGGHYRIPETEAINLLRTENKRNKDKSFGLEKKKRTKRKKVVRDEESRSCLTDNNGDNKGNGTGKNFLYSFGYGIGRGIHILKERR